MGVKNTSSNREKSQMEGGVQTFVNRTKLAPDNERGVEYSNSQPKNPSLVGRNELWGSERKKTGVLKRNYLVEKWDYITGGGYDSLVGFDDKRRQSVTIRTRLKRKIKELRQASWILVTKKIPGPSEKTPGRAQFPVRKFKGQGKSLVERGICLRNWGETKESQA